MNRDYGDVKMKAGFLAGWIAGLRASRLIGPGNSDELRGFLKHGRTAARVVMLYGGRSTRAMIDAATPNELQAIDEMIAFYDEAFAEYRAQHGTPGKHQPEQGGNGDAGFESENRGTDSDRRQRGDHDQPNRT